MATRTPRSCSASSVVDAWRRCRHQHGLGDLEAELRWPAARSSSSVVGDVLGEVGAGRTAGPTGSPTRSAAGRSGCSASTRAAAARLLEHPAPDRDDQAGLLGDRDELLRATSMPRFGVLPPHQRLDADDLPVVGSRRSAGSAARARPRRGPGAGSTSSRGGRGSRRRARRSKTRSGCGPRPWRAYIAASASRSSSSRPWRRWVRPTPIDADDEDAGGASTLERLLQDAASRRSATRVMASMSVDVLDAGRRTRRRRTGRRVGRADEPARAGRRPAISSSSPTWWP